MKRILIITATVLGAACAAAVPAFAGLSGNPSFSHKLPVQVPSQARVVQFDDHGRLTGEHPAVSDDGPSRTKTAEPSDDHGRVSGQEPGEDNGGAHASTEPGDDRGATTEPADDRGAPSTSDDHGAPSTAGARGSASPSDAPRHGGSDDSGHGGSHG